MQRDRSNTVVEDGRNFFCDRSYKDEADGTGENRKKAGHSQSSAYELWNKTYTFLCMKRNHRYAFCDRRQSKYNHSGERNE